MASTSASGSDKQASNHLQAPVFVDKPGRQSPRPSFTSSRPSWIGKQHLPRSITPEIPTMAQKHEIHYSHPGLQPPVFIAGSMCEPEWEPIEMTHKEKEDGELDFEHEFRAEPGEYQYKFRLGPGDWWVLDESKPTVDDGTGNRNNMIVVEPKSSNVNESHETPISSNAQEEEVPAATHMTDTHAKQNASVIDREEEDDDDIPESEKNLFRHETVQVANGTGESDHEDEHVEVDEDDQDEEPPLLEHEAGPFERVDSQHVTPFKSDKFTFEDPSEHAIEADDDFADDERDAPPLFRHETGAANDVDPDEAPLFRHESMSSPIDSMSASSLSPTSPTSRKQRKLDLEDVNDPSLEPFPVDEAGIQARIQRVATRRREDEVVFEGTPPSPSLAQTKSFSPQAAPTLPHNESSDLSHLDAIDETEETDEEVYKPVSKPVEKKDSVMQPVPINIKVQDVSELDNNPAFTDVADVSNRGPPTPPMTPTEHARSKAALHDGAADVHEVSDRVGSPRSRKDNATDHIANRPSPSETAKPSTKASAKPEKKIEPENSLASNLCIWFIGLCGGKGRAAGVAIAMSVAAAAFAMNTRSA